MHQINWAELGVLGLYQVQQRVLKWKLRPSWTHSLTG